MASTIQKWGNSLGVRIPKGMVDSLDLRAGTPVRMAVVKGALVISKPRRLRRKFGGLVAQMDRSGPGHKAVDFGAPVGKEVW